jgi:Na+/H+ antiporter NhaC
VLVLAGLIALVLLVVAAHQAGQRSAERAVHRWHLGHAKKRHKQLRIRVVWLVLVAVLVVILVYKAR